MVEILNKIKEKRGIIIAVAIVLAIAVFLLNSFSYKFVKLNERQIEILKQSDLPTDMEKLDSMQQDAIVEIENMLEYLDKKYDKKFCYNGFRFANKRAHQKRELIAYAEGDDPSYQCFSVTKERFGYKDDYGVVLAFPVYIDEITKEISGELKGMNYVVFPNGGSCDKKGKLNYVNLTIIIEMDEIEKTEQKFLDIEKVLVRRTEMGSISVFFVNEGLVEKCDNSNWYDVIEKDIVKHIITYPNTRGQLK